jgi:hypothetical protein
MRISAFEHILIQISPDGQLWRRYERTIRDFREPQCRSRGKIRHGGNPEFPANPTMSDPDSWIHAIARLLC